MKTTTYKELTDKHTIEIPIIQRDYAQGRKDAKATDIRNKFSQALIEAISSDDNPLSLDFIYGTIENDKFIPLDGQQRLTTLFLLHWYLCPDKKSLTNEGEAIFRYLTRTSSHDFCNALVNKWNGNILEDQLFSEYVRDQNWYLLWWDNDPTIRGMLTMLDELDGLIRTRDDKQQMWQRLSNNAITFDLIELSSNTKDISKYPLSDDIYIKLNARGKILSPFENFKSWLDENAEKQLGKESTILEEWRINIDTTWADLMWKHREKEGDENWIIDDEFMRFFNEFAYIKLTKNPIDFENNFLEKAEGKNEQKWKSEYRYLSNYFANEKLSNENLNKNICNRLTKQEEIPSEVYQLLEIFNEPMYNEIRKIFACYINKEGIGDSYKTIFHTQYIINAYTPINLFIDNKEQQDDVDIIFKQFVSENCSYKIRTLLYGITCFLKKYPITYNDERQQQDLKRWIRIIRNIVENNQIDDNNFESTVSLLEELVKQANNFYEFLASDIKLESTTFKEQIHEERIKAKLIIDNSDWEDALIEAENHPLFRGSVRFLLNNYPYDFTTGEITHKINIEIFKHRYAIALKYFDKDGVSNEYKKGKILLRALISRFNNWECLWHINYDNQSSTWRNIFKQKIWKHSIECLLDVKSDNIKEQLLTYIEEESRFLEKKEKTLHEDLYKSKFLESIIDGCILHDYYGCLILYPYNKKADWNKYIIGTNRNAILAEAFSQQSGLFKISDNGQYLKDESKQIIPYFWGWNIKFEYNSSLYYWTYDNLIFPAANKWRDGYEKIQVSSVNDLIEFINEKFPSYN